MKKIIKTITGPDGNSWKFTLKPDARMVFFQRRLGQVWGPELCAGGIHHVLAYFDGSFGEELAPVEDFSVNIETDSIKIMMQSPTNFWDPPLPHLQAPESFVRPHGEIKLCPGECENYPLSASVELKLPELNIKDKISVMFIDCLEIESVQNLNWFTRSPEKNPANPVIKADKPWESRVINCVGGTSLYSDGKYRMWYNACEQISQSFQPADGKLAENWQKFCNVCYAESDDGINWEKPNLNQVEYMGSKENNLIPSLWRCPVIVEDKQETDLQKRFKCFQKLELDTFVPELCKFHYSADGIKWHTHPAKIDYSGGARATIFVWNSAFYDEDEPNPEKRWKAYGYFATSPTRRTCGMAWSADGINWTSCPLNPIISPRQLGNNFIHDFVVWKESGHYLGIVQFGEEKTQYDFLLMASRDGIRFSRVGDDQFIARGERGQWDAGNISNGCCTPLIKGSKINFYYAGTDKTKKISGIGLASCDSKQLAGFKLADNKSEGILVSRQVTVNSDELKLLLNINSYQSDSVCCGLKRPNSDEYITGYSPAESQISAYSDTEYRAAWNQSEYLPKCSFKIEIHVESNTEIFGFSCRR